MNNLLEMIKMIKNPEQYVRNIANQQNNPMLNNLIEMAEKNNSQGIEQFARNMFKQTGQDFDEIMKLFK